MFEELFEELQSDLNAIAAGGTTTRPPDWRQTKILGNAGGLLADARKFLGPSWWKTIEPRDAKNQEILRQVERGQLRMSDGQAQEQEQYFSKAGGHSSASELAEHQREKAGVDDAEEYEKYLPDPGANAHQWYADLSRRVDVNTAERRGWFDALRSYIQKFTPATKAGELDQSALRTLVKMICTEEAA